MLISHVAVWVKIVVSALAVCVLSVLCGVQRCSVCCIVLCSTVSCTCRTLRPTRRPGRGGGVWSPHRRSARQPRYAREHERPSAPCRFHGGHAFLATSACDGTFGSSSFHMESWALRWSCAFSPARTGAPSYGGGGVIVATMGGRHRFGRRDMSGA